MSNQKTIIIGIFLRDGAAVSNYFSTLSDEFVKLGYRVIIIADEDRKNLVDMINNPMILTWPSHNPTKLKDFIFLKKLIRKYQVEMLISNFNTVNFFMIAGAIFGVPNRIAWIHTVSEAIHNDVPKWKFFRKRFIYKLATQIIVNSKATKKDAIQIYNIQEKKIILLPNLIKNNDQYINSKKEFKIVFVGRFYKSKGVDVLINAFSLIKNDFPEIELEIIGGGDQTEYIKLVKNLNIENSVHFLGRQPMETVLKHFASAQFSIVPSLAEAFGLVVIESFSVKTPVIGSNTGGIAEIIEDGKSGLLFPPGDYKTLVSKMEMLLGCQVLRNKLAEGAYQKFKDTYSLEKNVGYVAEMFHNLNKLEK